MRTVSPAFAATCGLFLVLGPGAAAQGLTGVLPKGDEPKQAPPAPAPANPNSPVPARPAPPAGAPAAGPAPPVSASANPEIEQKLSQLREQLAQRKSDTEATIQPLDSLDLIRQRLRQYRQRVDRTERQPFLTGAQLPPDLVAQAKAGQEQWGDLGGAIRAGRPPATIPVETLRRLSLPTTATGPVPVTGNLWSALSNDYFAATARVESLAEQRATPIRQSAGMRRLSSQMADAEARLREIEAAADNPESEPHRRELSWRLLRIWQLLGELQVRRFEQQLKAGPGDQALNQFLVTADSARALRHRGISLTAEGGAPVAAGAPPVLLVPTPAGATIRAQLDDTESSVNVKPAAPSRLVVLAAELYHVHYLLANVEEFEREPTNASALDRENRITARRRDYEGRRLDVLGEIVRETERLRSAGG